MITDVSEFTAYIIWREAGNTEAGAGSIKSREFLAYLRN
jgi:hypothetical protein